MEKVVAGMPATPKSERIRRLKRAGFRQADIARFENVRDQYVSNIARSIPATASAPQQAPASPQRVDLALAPDGRIVIPAAIREAMGLKDGGKLFGRLDDGELRLFTAETASRKLRSIVRKFVPEGVSLADELIRERRAEAEREASE
jgi:AbrB family looped-hinge helix DNA binding protein